MIRMELRYPSAVRPMENDRMYSTTWNRARWEEGIPTDCTARSARRSIDERYLAADGHHPLVLQHQAERLKKGFLVDDRVCIHREKERAGGGVDPGVQRIRLAPVFLVDDHPPDDPRREIVSLVVKAADRGGRDAVFVGDLHPPETEMVDDLPQRPVRGSVVHHDDLHSGKLQPHKGVEGLHDGFFLVESGNDDGQRRRKGRAEDDVEILVCLGAKPPSTSWKAMPTNRIWRVL
jgi:hypothetical protein